VHCRPSSTRLPATTFSLTTPDAPDIARVTLVKAGSATHSFDTDQRFVEPVFTISGNQVNIELPANQYERLRASTWSSSSTAMVYRPGPG